MTNFECKKCHKPLARGNKCDACKQKDRNKIKSIGSVALTIVLTVGGTALTILKNNKE